MQTCKKCVIVMFLAEVFGCVFAYFIFYLSSVVKLKEV